ncbi:MAG: ATP-dependent DNA helicase, partial [Alphaproteobacteria bacterium]|nr:ATP-dependent DNA helicase [Alphaproteobacteria bacterium]
MALEPIPARDWRRLPALVPAPGGAVVCDGDGACARVAMDAARRLFRSGDVLIAHAAFVSGRLKTPPAAALYDVLELFAFVRPGAPCIPSALGLARAMGQRIPQTTEENAAALREAAVALIDLLHHAPEEARVHMRMLAGTMGRAGWKWAAPILDVLGESQEKQTPIAGMETWRGLPQWEDSAAPDKPGSLPVSPDDARARLHALVHRMGEMRPEQAEYSDAAAFAFSARDAAGAPKVALVEAGTGVGKTLGYLAPASLWAEKNGPGLWISTYTRNLQRQIVQEIGHLYPDPDERAEKAVVRKGRENYLCLLNFEEAARRTALAPGQRAVTLGLIARWVGVTPDGDVSGAGFPAFLGSTMPLSEVTDRRGECVYAACPHYRTCFIERAIRRARHAPIVVANHALVIAQASQDWLNIDETTDTPPEKRVRYVFDEGHHLFDAADSGFAPLLSGQEMTDLRRWVRGPEGAARSRMRGLQERLRDLLLDDRDGEDILGEALNASGVLSAAGWMSRLHGGGPRGPGEMFLAAVYQHVRARSGDEADSFYTLEAEIEPLSDELLRAAQDLARGLKRLSVPLMRLSAHLKKQLDTMSDELQSFSRARIDAAARALAWRGKYVIPTWIAMLDSLEGPRDEQFVDWFEIAREDGRDVDVGLERHWVDPTVPLARDVLAPAHGALITSATLRDIGEGVDDWQSAEVRTGAGHLPEPPKRASFGSPFNYAEQARIFIVKDVNRRDVDQIA